MTLLCLRVRRKPLRRSPRHLLVNDGKLSLYCLLLFFFFQINIIVADGTLEKRKKIKCTHVTRARVDRRLKYLGNIICHIIIIIVL